MRFRLETDFAPSEAQAAAIEALVRGVEQGARHQVLLGVTGSGKTFTMAAVIERLQKPTLVIAPNKTLAAQLYQEFRTFFPHNAVEYFVSYYDYYQPEAYIPATDTYIEKEVLINEEIDRLRLSATRSLFERRDVLIVASVSCIYGLGSPETFYGLHLYLEVGQTWTLTDLLYRLVELQYERVQGLLRRGTFRVVGDRIELFPTFEEWALRIVLEDDVLTEMVAFDSLTGQRLERFERKLIFPRTHYVTTRPRLLEAVESIRAELEARVRELEAQGRHLEARRLYQRTTYDLELLLTTGYCRGIENYSRHLDGRRPGEPPATLLDYFPDDFLTIIDESHITIPQLRGMYEGDRSRKQTLVEYGFRLPSALDNRPLNFEEFEARVRWVLYVSATPGPYEVEKSGGRVVEQLIRPTGLMDPVLEVRPTHGQMEDLLGEIRRRVERNERVLVATLTKRMAEDLTQFLQEHGVRARYLHADIDTLDRVAILRDLRMGVFDVLVGVNLLREGLDLPEVSLVAILDADKEGFLRSPTALIQMSGRAARNVHGTVLLYADRVTPAIRQTIEETQRRRRIQEAYNRRHGITPRTIQKRIHELIGSPFERDYLDLTRSPAAERPTSREALEAQIEALERQMWEAAERLDFETAARLRDEVRRLRRLLVTDGLS